MIRNEKLCQNKKRKTLEEMFDSRTENFFSLFDSRNENIFFQFLFREILVEKKNGNQK